MTGPKVRRLGRVGFREAWDLQKRLGEALLRGEGPELILALEHPPVITLGRSTQPGDAGLSAEEWRARGVEVVPVDRGGRATYHGPGQVVVYPIVDLRRRGRDVRAYVHALEDAAAAALQRFGIPARPGRDPVGVFVGPAKVASIGVAVRRWITRHGIAVNVVNDLRVYRHFTPCGLTGVPMTRVADHAPVPLGVVREAVIEEILVRLKRMEEPRDPCSRPS